MNRLIHTLLVAFLPFLLWAQPKYEGGVFLGIANYQGDLTKHSIPELGESNLAFGFTARRNIDYNWAARANLLYGRLSGSDFNFFDRKGRGIDFKTTVIELTVMGEWEPFGYTRYRSGKTRFQKLISPYVNAGFGFLFINPNTNYNMDLESSLSDEKERDARGDYAKLNFVIPISAGVKIDVTEDWVISLELGFRYPFTDYLDGVSEAGNPAKNDWYLFGGPSLMYRFPK